MKQVSQTELQAGITQVVVVEYSTCLSTITATAGRASSSNKHRKLLDLEEQPPQLNCACAEQSNHGQLIVTRDN